VFKGLNSFWGGIRNECSGVRLGFKIFETNFFFNPLKMKNVKVPAKYFFAEGSQASSLCPGKSTTWMKMDMEHWWNGFIETIFKDPVRTAQ